MKSFVYSVFSVLFLALTFSTYPALAAAIHIPADQPTIQDGIDAAIDGDFVLVATGTYVENINFRGKTITLQSEAGAELTVIDGDQNGPVLRFSNDETEESIIEGFTIRNGSGTYFEWTPGVWDYCGGGIFCYASSPTITNCTITGNSAGEDGGGIKCDDSTLTITNCILWGDSALEGSEIWIGTIFDPSTLTVNYSDVQGGEADVHIEGTSTLDWTDGNIDSDPRFVTDWNYHLRPLSPCINAGTDAGVYTDIDGQSRP